jgi:hypothetical protein
MSDGLSIGLVILAVLLSLGVTVLFYYIVYKIYSSGQDKCTELYPGNSLKMLRQREQCKDSKRGNWSTPLAALFVSSALRD